MQFIPAPMQLPFEVTYDSPALYVGLVVYDVTTPSAPVQIQKTLMANLAGTNSFFGVFTPDINKTYVISKAVYTNMALTTIDSNYSEASESIACGAVKIAGDQIAIKKGVAFPNFSFIMLGSTSQTPIEMLTVYGFISKDGGAFAALTNSVAEISDGWYKVDLTAGETDCNVFALNFTALGADPQCATIPTQE